MPVNNNVDLIFFHDAQIGFGLQRKGRAEHDILQIGGHHRTAPTVGQRSSGALFNDVFVVLINAHMGAMHDLHNFTVDVARQHAQLLPAFIQRLGSALEIIQLAFRFAPFSYGFFGHFEGNFVQVTVDLFAIHFDFDIHPKMGGDCDQFVGVFNFVVTGFFVGNCQKDFGNIAPMI